MEASSLIGERRNPLQTNFGNSWQEDPLVVINIENKCMDWAFHATVAQIILVALQTMLGNLWTHFGQHR